VSETYYDKFEEHLEMRLRDGGAPDYMVSIARIYKGDEYDLRNYAFREWVDGQEFKCEKCGSRFNATADMSSEHDDVLCLRCKTACK
jgi:hypothetical protein